MEVTWGPQMTLTLAAIYSVVLSGFGTRALPCEGRSVRIDGIHMDCTAPRDINLYCQSPEYPASPLLAPFSTTFTKLISTRRLLRLGDPGASSLILKKYKTTRYGCQLLLNLPVSDEVDVNAAIITLTSSNNGYYSCIHKGRHKASWFINITTESCNDGTTTDLFPVAEQKIPSYTEPEMSELDDTLPERNSATVDPFIIDGNCKGDSYEKGHKPMRPFVGPTDGNVWDRTKATKWVWVPAGIFGTLVILAWCTCYLCKKNILCDQVKCAITRNSRCAQLEFGRHLKWKVVEPIGT